MAGTVTAAALQAWDWFLVVWSLAVVVGVGVWYSRRAGRSLDEYFLSGRSLPWWALGTSMVATTFAADTPLAVGELVVEDGIAGNWLWWNFLIGAALTVFLFSRWWRRARITTEIELLALRYDGRAARALRGFKAVYFGLVLNSLVIGWVTKAMVGILATIFPEVPPGWILAGLIALTLAYTALSGLWGVVATDVLQFTLAMVGSILLAVLSVRDAGGLGRLVARVRELEVEHGRNLLSLFPSGADAFSFVVLVLVLVNWWAVYYPGVEPGGGGYVAQRMLAAKDERHARAGTLWFLIAHFVLRPWPWVLVALAAIVRAPEYLAASGAPAPATAYPSMFSVLPVGLYGLVIGSFLAAYMSTITTQLNLAASYLVNDLYRPFLARDGMAPRREVHVARIAVAIVTAAGCLVSYLLVSVSEGWNVMRELTAGTGLVLILRWLWWRVNAWSEIAAIVASALAFTVSKLPPCEAALLDLAGRDAGAAAQLRLVGIVLCTSACWILVTYATRPVGAERLQAFYRLVRPGGWWQPLAQATGIPVHGLRLELAMWGTSIALAFGALFATGSLLLLDFRTAFLSGAIAALAAFVLRALFLREARAEARAEAGADVG